MKCPSRWVDIEHANKTNLNNRIKNPPSQPNKINLWPYPTSTQQQRKEQDTQTSLSWPAAQGDDVTTKTPRLQVHWLTNPQRKDSSDPPRPSPLTPTGNQSLDDSLRVERTRQKVLELILPHSERHGSIHDSVL